MSPVYYVAPWQETDGEPSSGYYFVMDAVPYGPYSSHGEAMDAFNTWVSA